MIFLPDSDKLDQAGTPMNEKPQTTQANIVNFQAKNSPFRWMDVCNPSVQELRNLAQEFHIHQTLVEDCLEPHHLPKYQRIDQCRFILVRIADAQAKPHAATVYDLTRKVAIFVSDEFLLTIHRSPLPLMDEMRNKWSKRLETYEGNPRAHLVLDLLSESFQTFDEKLDAGEEELETMELSLFGLSKKRFVLRKMYRLKRRVAVYKRILRLSSEVIARFAAETAPEYRVFVQDLKEDLENTLFYAEDLADSLNQAFNMHYNLESQRANEVMRVLTLFSAFFFPLSFIAGVYGMNFKYMPELEWRHGYFYCLALMGLCAIGIWFWFKRKKWL